MDWQSIERWTLSNCPGHYFSTLYLSIYNIFPYFLYILNICLDVVTFFCSRGLLCCEVKGRGGFYSLLYTKRCLHLSQYIKVNTYILFSETFLVSRDFSPCQSEHVQKMVVAADKSEVFFYCYLPALSCIDLFMRLYLFTCKRPMLNVHPETGQCLWRKGPVDSFKQCNSFTTHFKAASTGVTRGKQSH